MPSIHTFYIRDGDDDVLAYAHNICAYMVRRQKRHTTREDK